MKPTAISLFASNGGICLGFKQAGFDVVWANEYDAAACRTYRHNFGNEYLVEADIRSIHTNDIPDFDVLTAGFPCQPFNWKLCFANFRNRRQRQRGTRVFI